MSEQEAKFAAEQAVAALDASPVGEEQCVASYLTGLPALLQFKDASSRKLPCITSAGMLSHRHQCSLTGPCWPLQALE